MRTLNLLQCQLGPQALGSVERGHRPLGLACCYQRQRFKDQRQMEAWVASGGEPRFLDRFDRALGQQQKTSQHPTPECQPMVPRAEPDAVPHTYNSAVEVASQRECRAEGHVGLRVTGV